MKEEELVLIKNKSISDKNKLKRAYYKGERKGIREGFLKGSIATFFITSALTVGYRGVTELTHAYPVNQSIKKAYESYFENSHITADKKHYWVDFLLVADKYDPETMDFDSYLYGVYCGLGNVDLETKIKDMNIFVHHLFVDNKTEYSSFVLYCKDRGLCKIEDGNYVVDTKKYNKALEEYLKDYAKRTELDNEIKDFKEGKAI